MSPIDQEDLYQRNANKIFSNIISALNDLCVDNSEGIDCNIPWFEQYWTESEVKAEIELLNYLTDKEGTGPKFSPAQWAFARTLTELYNARYINDYSELPSFMRKHLNTQHRDFIVRNRLIKTLVLLEVTQQTRPVPFARTNVLNTYLKQIGCKIGFTENAPAGELDKTRFLYLIDYMNNLLQQFNCKIAQPEENEMEDILVES